MSDDKLIMKVAVYECNDSEDCCDKCDLDFDYCDAECRVFDEPCKSMAYFKLIDDGE